MGSRYDGVCLRQPGIGRSHGPVRPSCLGRARGNRVAEARGSCGGMAGATGGDKATVSREMAGNSFAVGSGRGHRASTAQRGRESRRVSCVRPGILDGERGAGLVRRLVVREHRSPGRIAGGIAVERPGLMVFASAIYRAINERRLDPPGLTRTRRGIRARLRHKGKRRRGRGGPEERRGEIPGARPIGQRPEIVGGGGTFRARRPGRRRRRRQRRRGVPRHARGPQKRSALRRTLCRACQTRRCRCGDRRAPRASGGAGP